VNNIFYEYYLHSLQINEGRITGGQSVELHIDPERSTVKLGGSFDRRTCPTIRKKLLKFIKKNNPRVVTVDLSGMEAMDSAGIAVLVEVLSALSRRGGKMKLSGLNDTVIRMIHLARLGQAFGI
jgi:anti-sigma B factor antagonist